MCSKELWLVQENHATVKLDSGVASRGMKTYSESRIELRNLQIDSIRFEFWMKGGFSDGGNLCPLWLEILKSVWNSVGDTS